MYYWFECDKGVRKTLAMAGQTMRWFSKTIGSYTLDKEHTICLRIQNILRSNTLAVAVIQRLDVIYTCICMENASTHVIPIACFVYM